MTESEASLDPFVRQFDELTVTAAQFLTSIESNSRRKAKLARVVEKKRELLQEIKERNDSYELAEADPDVGGRLCIDLAFCQPFAPYDLHVSEKDRELAVRNAGISLGMTHENISAILAARKGALKALGRKLNLKIAVLFGATAALVAVAPAIGLASFSALTGLSGAAALASGVALLGGGSLAVGGAGLSGGIWILGSAAGVATVGLTSYIAPLLNTLSAEAYKVELAKMYVSLMISRSRYASTMPQLQKLFADLSSRAGELQEALNDERELNDRGSRRVADLEDKLKATRLIQRKLRQAFAKV